MTLKLIIRYFIFALFVFVVNLDVSGKNWSVSEIEQPRLHNRQNWVVNPDGIISTSTVDRLNSLLNDINQKTSAEMVVVVIDNFHGKDIESFATELYNKLGVGKKNASTGALLIVAKGDGSYTLRTGRGMGEVLTDGKVAEIGRNYLIPNAKNGNFDEAVLQTVSAVRKEVITPEAIDAIHSVNTNAEALDDDDLDLWEGLTMYLGFSILMTLFLSVWAIVKVRGTKGVERHRRYVELHPVVRTIFGLSFVGLGLPFFVYLPLKTFVNNLRNGEHKCPNCGDRMTKLDEETDNLHLTPSQDAEERLGSVDYDVWVCPTCGEEDIYAFRNEDSELTVCPHCHSRAARYVRDRVVKMPTATADGVGVKEFQCMNCGKMSQKQFRIPRNSGGSNVAGVAAGIAAASILSGLGGRGGGGFGGTLGGGVTGGGGASGRW